MLELLKELIKKYEVNAMKGTMTEYTTYKSVIQDLEKLMKDKE